MNARINQLVKSLLQKESLDQCSLNELQQFADRHPHFGAAQLLLTKKLQEEKSDRFDDQLQKTYLFFHNPLWVEHLLNDTGTASIKQAPKKEETPKQEETTTPETIAPIALTEIAEPSPELTGQLIPATLETPVAAGSILPSAIETAVAEPEEQEIMAVTENTAITNAEPPIILPEFKIEPFDPSKAELTFEPYHTVDYFASQGINFKEEGKPTDKFGKQLKSFTDWLKTMKRLPVAETARNTEPAADRKVEQLAEHSLEEREVVTEAMAEVWEKQGNSAKAIDIYTKLSLLEPAKSPYFAAKIEDLKKLN